MHRNQVLQLLTAYTPTNPLEISFRREMTDFIQNNPECFERTLQTGHVTGSAWIIDQSKAFALFTHHQKLDKWLQPGGHCDGESDVLGVAAREAEEETGLSEIVLHHSGIFDIDIHRIPANKSFPTHLHYDIRFLFIADKQKPLILSSESKNLAWIPLTEVIEYNNDISVMRMVEKTKLLS